jgi:hypothetical protein
MLVMLNGASPLFVSVTACRVFGLLTPWKVKHAALAAGDPHFEP